VSPKLDNPFIGYNVDILMQAPTQLKSLVLFENYRFGLSTGRENTLTITLAGQVRELKEPVITIGRLDENRVRCRNGNLSGRWRLDQFGQNPKLALTSDDQCLCLRGAFLSALAPLCNFCFLCFLVLRG
jgi:hypothetical protein